MKRIITALIFIFQLSIFSLPVSAAAPTTISISPASQTATVSAHPTVSVNIAGVQNLGSYQFTLKYNPAIIRVLSGTDGGFLGSTGQTVTPLSQINNASGSATFGAFSFGSNTGPSGSGTLANINLEAIGAGTSTLNLSDLILTDNAAADIAYATGSGQITVSANQSQIASESATLTLTQITGSILTGTNFDVGLELDTKTASVSGVDAVILFDPAKFVAVSITNLHLLPQTPKTDINNGSGVIRISQLAATNSSYTGSGRMATVKFKPLFSGSANLGFQFTQSSKADSNVISKATGNDILTAPDTLTITANTQSTLVINYAAPTSVFGTISDTGSTWTSSWTGTAVTTDQFSGQTKTFTYKVAGYLTKRFTVTFAPGENYVDLGQLLAGDLNDDGIINNVDLSLMYDQWFSTGNADINNDGIVNSGDYWSFSNNFLKTND